MLVKLLRLLLSLGFLIIMVLTQIGTAQFLPSDDMDSSTLVNSRALLTLLDEESGRDGDLWLSPEHGMLH